MPTWYVQYCSRLRSRVINSSRINAPGLPNHHISCSLTTSLHGDHLATSSFFPPAAGRPIINNTSPCYRFPFRYHLSICFSLISILCPWCTLRGFHFWLSGPIPAGGGVKGGRVSWVVVSARQMSARGAAPLTSGMTTAPGYQCLETRVRGHFYKPPAHDVDCSWYSKQPTTKA